MSDILAGEPSVKDNERGMRSDLQSAGQSDEANNAGVRVVEGLREGITAVAEGMKEENMSVPTQEQLEGCTEYTLEELRRFDGVLNARILLAVNGKVYDVTSGKQHYAQGVC